MLTLTSPVETAAHRWPAGGKLAGLAICTFVLFQVPYLWFAAAVFALLVGAAAVLGLLRPWAWLLTGLWPFVAVLAIWHLWQATPSAGAVTILRLLAAVGAANLVSMTTRLTDMQAVFQSLARPFAFVLPPKVLGLAMALVIRFIPVMLTRMEVLAMAYRARSGRNARWRIILPAVLAALDDAEQVADALRARGGAG